MHHYHFKTVKLFTFFFIFFKLVKNKLSIINKIEFYFVYQKIVNN